MTAVPLRIVVADDHPIVLDGLKTLLAGAPDMQIVGIVTSFSAVITLLAQLSADVLILDLHGMGSAPLALVARLQREHPHTKILIFSSNYDFAPELLQTGVCGYVTKEELGQHLLAAIRAVHRGERYLSRVVQEAIDVPGRTQPLSQSELVVLKLLARGLGTEAIAAQMGILTRSTQNYITDLRRKLNCAERTQLVDWYRRVYGDEA